jgi:arylsulfatase A-like enzyme
VLFRSVEILPSFRGRSVRSVIDKPQSAWRDFLVTELATDPQETSHKARMIRTARYKYNLFSKGERNEQLFDLVNDPGETQNLAYEPAMKQVKDRHKERLGEWVKETADDFDGVLNR